MVKYSAEELVPLTWQQRIVWFEQLLDPESPRYNFYAVFHLECPPDLGFIRSQLATALRRHPSMRVRVSPDITHPCQIVPAGQLSPDDVIVREVRLSQHPGSSAELLKAAGCDQRFDLARGPLVRWTVVYLPDGQVTMVHAEHHLVHDGISFVNFLKSLNSAGADAVDAGYFRYASGQQGPSREAAEGLAAELASVGLVRVEGHAIAPSGEDFGVRIRFPDHLVRLVWNSAKRLRATPFTILFSAFSYAIGQFQGWERFVIGTALGNRPAGFEQSVGMFVAVAPVFMTCTDDMTPDTHVKVTARRLNEAIERQTVPIPDLVRVLGMGGKNGRPVISVAFSLFVDPFDGIDIGGSRATVEVGVFNGASKFDLDAIAIMSGSGDRRAIELIITADGSRLGPADIDTLGTMMTARLRSLEELPAPELLA